VLGGVVLHAPFARLGLVLQAGAEGGVDGGAHLADVLDDFFLAVLVLGELDGLAGHGGRG
jgi:hypothetical protein